MWQQDKLRNPRTGRAITASGAIYRLLQTSCGKAPAEKKAEAKQEKKPEGQKEEEKWRDLLPATIELSNSKFEPQIIVNELKGSTFGSDVFNKRTFVTLKWIISGTSPLARFAAEHVMLGVLQAQQLVKIDLAVEENGPVYLSQFHSLLAVSPVALGLASADEQQAAKGLAYRSLCRLLRAIVARTWTRPEQPFTLEASGTIPGKHMAGLIAFYEKSLGLKHKPTAVRTRTGDVVYQHSEMVGTVRGVIAACLRQGQ